MSDREAAPAAAPLRVAYLVNQYPLLSHSFIRREIRALEADGLSVLRIAVRPRKNGSQIVRMISVAAESPS